MITYFSFWGELSHLRLYIINCFNRSMDLLFQKIIFKVRICNNEIIHCKSKQHKTGHANTHIYFQRPDTTSSQTKSTIPFVQEHIRSRQTHIHVHMPLRPPHKRHSVCVLKGEEVQRASLYLIFLTKSNAARNQQRLFGVRPVRALVPLSTPEHSLASLFNPVELKQAKNGLTMLLTLAVYQALRAAKANVAPASWLALLTR